MNRYLELFWSFFKIGLFTFGGGYAMIPIIQNEVIRRRGWIEERDFLDLLTLAQSAPGPIAVNAAILVGYRTAGIPGALLSILGSVLPPLVIISIISLFYQAFRSNRFVSAAMAAMSAGVAAVVIDAVITMAWDVIKGRKALPIAMMLASFILAAFLDVNVIAILIAAGAVGFIASRTGRKG